MDKLNELKKKIEEMQTKSLVASDMKAFVTLVLSVVKKYKDELTSLSQENIQVIKDSIAYIKKNNDKWVSQYDKTNVVVGKFENKISILKDLIEKVESIKAPEKGVDYFDGENPDPSEVVPLVLEKLPKVELDDRLKIVEKINKGKKNDTKIELKQIEGTDKLEAGILDRAVGILDQRTKFLINKNVKHDNTLSGSGTDSDPLSVIGGGSGHTIQDEGTPLTSRANLNFVGAGVTVTDGGAGTDDTIVTIPGGGTVGPGTINEIAYFDSANTVTSLAVATYPSLTELSYIKGLSSAIQTQLNGKVNLDQTTPQTIGDTTNRLAKAWMTDLVVTNAILGSMQGASTSSGILMKNYNGVTVASFGVGAADSTNIALSGTVALGANNITMTGSIGATGVGKITKIWGVDAEFTNLPTINGGTLATALSLSSYAPLTSPTFQTSINGAYLTASEILITDGSKNIVSAPVATYPSLTELTYVKGVTSAIQTQIGTKAAHAKTMTIAGTANQITSSAGAQDLSANRTWTLSFPTDVIIPTILTVPNTGLHLLDTNASHDLIIKPGSDLTADKTLTITTGDTDMILNLTATTDEYVLAYDVTSNTWRGVAASGGSIDGSGTTNEIPYWVDSNTLGTLAVATYPSLTELSYVKGVTSAIQTQFSGKASLASANAFTVGGHTITVADTTNVKGLTIYMNDLTNDPLALQVGPDAAKVTTSSLVQFNDTNGSNSDWSFNVSGGGYPTINLQSSRGTLGTPTQSTAGDSAGSINGYIYNSTPTQKQITEILFQSIDTTAGSEDSSIIFRVATAGTLASKLELIGASLYPTTSDGLALGSTTKMFSDLFLASGAVINFNNGNVTLTHSAGVLTLGGSGATTLALGTNSITMTGSIAATGARVTKGWFTDIESTNMPTVGGTAILTSLTAPQFTTIELGHATANTLSASGGVLSIEGVVIPTISSTNTFTNKRVTLRVASTTDDATAVIDSDSYDEYYLTAIANATEISVSGTPTSGQEIFIGLKDAGAAKALTWTGITGLGVTLPTTTVVSKQHIIRLKYIASAWYAIAVNVSV